MDIEPKKSLQVRAKLINTLLPFLGHLVLRTAQRIGPECPDNFSIREVCINSPQVKEPVAIFFMSDLHIGAHYTDPLALKGLFYKLEVEMQQTPGKKMLILGGDDVSEAFGFQYPATTEREHTQYCKELASLKAFVPDLKIYAVHGNHDYQHPAYYQFKQKITDAGVVGIEGEILPFPSLGIQIMGLPDYSTQRSHYKQNKHNELATGLDQNLFTIAVAHDPSVYNNKHNLPISLPESSILISGHTHRGQHPNNRFLGQLLNHVAVTTLGIPPNYLEPEQTGPSGELVLISSGIGRTNISQWRTLPPEIIKLLLTPSSSVTE